MLNKPEACCETRQRAIHEQVGFLQGAVGTLRDQWDALEKRLQVVTAPNSTVPNNCTVGGVGPKDSPEKRSQVAESLGELREMITSLSARIEECERRIEV